MRSIELLPGDLILVRSPSLLGVLIRRYQRSPGEERSLVNHAAGVVAEGSVESAIIVEALLRVTEHTLWKAYHGDKDALAIYRMPDLTHAQRYCIAAHARKYVGRKYGVVKLFGHLGDWWLSRKFGREVSLFRRIVAMDKYPICSWVWAHAYHEAIGYRFCGRPPKDSQPDHMWDDVTASSSWECVLPMGRI